MQRLNRFSAVLAFSVLAVATSGVHAQNYGTLGSAGAGGSGGSGSSTSGSAGSATPQPYTQPKLRSAPSAAPNSPRLLNSPSVNPPSRVPKPTTTLAPPDGPVPELEQQIKRNSEGLKPEQKPTP